MPRTRAVLPAALLLALTPLPALAYVGPGAGISMLGALIGVVAAILLAVAGILAWPIRAMLRKRREVKAETTTYGEDNDSST